MEASDSVVVPSDGFGVVDCAISAVVVGGTEGVEMVKPVNLMNWD